MEVPVYRGGYGAFSNHPRVVALGKERVGRTRCYLCARADSNYALILIYQSAIALSIQEVDAATVNGNSGGGVTEVHAGAEVGPVSLPVLFCGNPVIQPLAGRAPAYSGNQPVATPPDFRALEGNAKIGNAVGAISRECPLLSDPYAYSYAQCSLTLVTCWVPSRRASRPSRRPWRRRE